MYDSDALYNYDFSKHRANQDEDVSDEEDKNYMYTANKSLPIKHAFLFLAT